MKKCESSATCWPSPLHAATEVPEKAPSVPAAPGPAAGPTAGIGAQARVGEPAKAQGCTTAMRAASWAGGRDRSAGREKPPHLKPRSTSRRPQLGIQAPLRGQPARHRHRSGHTRLCPRPSGGWGPSSAQHEPRPGKSRPLSTAPHGTERLRLSSLSSQSCPTPSNDPGPGGRGSRRCALRARRLSPLARAVRPRPPPTPPQAQQQNDGADFEHAQASRGGTATPE